MKPEWQNRRPLRKGEVQLNPIDGHTDVRNDADSCFGHPGIDWCERCGAVFGTPEWKLECEPKCVECGYKGKSVFQNGQWSCAICFSSMEDL